MKGFQGQKVRVSKKEDSIQELETEINESKSEITKINWDVKGNIL